MKHEKHNAAQPKKEEVVQPVQPVEPVEVAAHPEEEEVQEPEPLTPEQQHASVGFVHYTLDTEPIGECRMAVVLGAYPGELLDLLVIDKDGLVHKEGVHFSTERALNHWHALG